MAISLILLGIVLALAFWGVAIYNGLIRARNAFKNAFAQIDVQLQRRFDLIPNLVETAKGYLKHERETLEAVIAARTAAVSGLAAAKAQPGDPAAMEQLAQSQGALNNALGRLLAISEAYPDLKANTNFQQLQMDLSDLENKLAAARRFFNNAVSEFNASIQAFPAVLFAASMGFTPREFFDVGPETRSQIETAPTVKF